MDAETVANIIKPLGKRDFDAVVVLLLTRFFHLKVMDVDGRGDAGSDWRVFRDPGGATTAAFQVTVQLAQWKEKVLSDARKAVDALKATRYFFLTSRAHDSGDLRVLESEIISALGVPATCLGANEIADLITRAKLVAPLLDAVQMPVSVNLAERPDRKEILLHAYVTLGQDTADLRSSVYDDSLILSLRESTAPLPRGPLVEAAANLLGCKEPTKVKLERRVDSLLARGLIEFNSATSTFDLSSLTKTDVLASERIYASEFDGLASAQEDLMRKKFHLDWTTEDARRATLLLAKAFVQRQLETAARADVELLSLGLTRQVGDPLQELRDLLVDRGVNNRRVNGVVAELVQNAEGLPIINKLARAAVFVAIEGAPPLSGAKAIGANNWADVTATLDASVAIPYLCAKRSAPTHGRFSEGATQIVTDLLGLGATLNIPGVYLNECASHLLAALDYAQLDRFADELRFSKNGFVAHYFALRAAGANVPNDISAFLRTFAPSLRLTFADRGQWVRRIMSDLQPLLRDFGVDYEQVSRVPQHFRDDVEKVYAHKMRDLGRKKYGLLIEHDVFVLSHLRRSRKENGESRICLTWDAVMIGVGQEMIDCGWVVSPHEAADFVQAFKPLGQAKLISLAHSLAGINDRPMAAAARIIDTVVRYAKDKLQDWEFQEKVDALKADLLGRIDITSAAYRDYIEEATEEFLRTQGVDLSNDSENGNGESGTDEPGE
jgi:hypothetical protein